MPMSSPQITTPQGYLRRERRLLMEQCGGQVLVGVDQVTVVVIAQVALEAPKPPLPR